MSSVVRPSWTASATPAGLLFISTMSEDSIASSVPDFMEMPTRAPSQSRGVVHAVPYHRHLVPAFLHLHHMGGLFIREHVGDHLVNVEFSGHVPRPWRRCPPSA